MFSQRYPYLGEDSLYRDSTEAFIKRTITPVMASLAELIRCKTKSDICDLSGIVPNELFDPNRKTDCYSEHYDWFVDLARNFHRIQTETVRTKNDFAVVCHGDLVSTMHTCTPK